ALGPRPPHTRTIVGDGERQPARVARQGDLDRAAERAEGIFDGIRHQLVRHGSERGADADVEDDAALDVADERDAALAGPVKIAHPVAEILEIAAQIEALLLGR